MSGQQQQPEQIPIKMTSMVALGEKTAHVQIDIGDAQVVMSIDEATDFGTKLMQVAEAARSDLLVAIYLAKKLGLDPDNPQKLSEILAEYRYTLETEGALRGPVSAPASSALN